MMGTNHFFHNLKEWILEMDNPRNQSYITYTQADLGYMAILKNVCSLHSMRKMEENFNKETCIDTLRILSGNQYLEEMPHCENCSCTMKTGEDGKKTKRYYHKVLEAKIVLSDKVIVSLGTEFIENEGFNNQKKGIYRIEHLNSKNSKAMKKHCLLTQISDILMQLYVAWNPYIKELKQTIKNTSSGLLESFRRLTVTEEDVSRITRLFYHRRWWNGRENKRIIIHIF